MITLVVGQDKAAKILTTQSVEIYLLSSYIRSRQGRVSCRWAPSMKMITTYFIFFVLTGGSPPVCGYTLFNNARTADGESCVINSVGVVFLVGKPQGEIPLRCGLNKSKDKGTKEL